MRSRWNTLASLHRHTLLLAMTLVFAGCEVIADIFQAGFVVGIIIVLVILGVVAWVFRKFSGR